jgi:hypothetical protein
MPRSLPPVPPHCIKPGQYAKFRGSWGRVVLVGSSYVFLEHWRGQLVATAPIEEIVDVKEDRRLRLDQTQSLGRRLGDF